MDFAVRHTDGRRRTLVAVSGALDAAAAASLLPALEDAVLFGAPVLVDLTWVTSVERAGVTVLIAAQRQAALAGTSLLLRTTPAQIPMLLAAAKTAWPIEPMGPIEPDLP